MTRGENFITATIEGDVLITSIIIVAIAMSVTDALAGAIAYEKGAIRHDVIITEKGNSPGKNFLDFYVHNA